MVISAVVELGCSNEAGAAVLDITDVGAAVGFLSESLGQRNATHPPADHWIT